MSRSGSRVHRLPKRTDYKLIPAPLDLSLPLVSEKSPLPAIIVTPSSPSSTRDFSIAFLAQPPPPTLTQRVTSSLGSFSKLSKALGFGRDGGDISLSTSAKSPFTRVSFPSGEIAIPNSTLDLDQGMGNHNPNGGSKFRLRSALFVFVILSFIFMCHLVTYTLASVRRHPHLDFNSHISSHLHGNGLVHNGHKYVSFDGEVGDVGVVGVDSVFGREGVGASAPAAVLDKELVDVGFVNTAVVA